MSDSDQSLRSRGQGRCLIDEDVVRTQPEANHISGLQDSFRDSAAIDKRAVWRAAIDHTYRAVNHFDLCMLAGDFGVADNKLILTRGATDAQTARFNWKRLAG